VHFAATTRSYDVAVEQRRHDSHSTVTVTLQGVKGGGHV
jgi:hypothetical protein